MPDASGFAARALACAREAATIILDRRARGAAPSRKGDGTPVTDADRDAEASIVRTLRAAFPDLPIVSEEAAASGTLPARIAHAYALVDALDGTREFVGGGSDFTVNIALVAGGSVAASVVLLPACGTAYLRDGRGSFRLAREEETRLRVDPGWTAPGRAVRIVASRSHMDAATRAYCERWRAARACRFARAGSSLKICRLAENGADIYPRLAPTMQWDTAAAQGVLEGAGGCLHVAGAAGADGAAAIGARLRYAPPVGPDARGTLRNPAFVAFAAAEPVEPV